MNFHCYNTLPFLCIHGAVVFPQAVLPIPMTMSQYEILLSETQETEGILGVIQPTDITQPRLDKLPVFQLGTAVLIADMEPEQDDLAIVHLKGLCRFTLLEEVPKVNLMRRGIVSYKSYVENDMGMQISLDSFDKKSFINLAKLYLTQYKISPDWQDLAQASDSELITFIAMAGPLAAAEKQAILEKKDLNQQKNMLEKIMDMSLSDSLDTSHMVH